MEKRIGSDEVYAVVSSKGGTVKEFVWFGKNIIYPEFQDGDKSRGGIPICFPFFSKMPGRFDALQRHGWLRHQELELMADSNTYVIFHGRNEATEIYPWELMYDVKVFFNEFGLNLNLVVQRLRDRQAPLAPINPGFHPYFSSHGSNRTGHSAFVGSKEISDFRKESARVDAADMVFIDSGEWRSCMRLNDGFGPQSILTLWSDRPEEYFCVEPVLTDPAVAATANGTFLREEEVLEISCCINYVYDIR